MEQNKPIWLLSSAIQPIENPQEQVNNIYGKRQWKIIDFQGGHEPVTVRHKCGKEKVISRYSQFKLGKTKCECQHVQAGRKKMTKEDLAKRIHDATYGTYELLEFTDSSKFTVNHKSCDRKPLRTSTTRFFTRGQRCACSKKGVVGRKPKNETAINEED